MKKILLYITIIAINLVVADRIFYYFFTNYVFAKTLSGDTGGAINYSLQKKENVDCIILGSSRAKYLIDPAL
ncbi:MAG TPA: hypothetical protein VK484_12305, partial [Ferruginibacter sp.]|nr:hypothetical protein [Ferruginibacter sp.]